MFDIGWPELLIVLVLVVLIFGPGRLSKTMGELGKGIRSFRDTFSSDEEKPDSLSESVSDPNLNPK
jgi:sec-independent protein translocase protein TatA